MAILIIWAHVHLPPTSRSQSGTSEHAHLPSTATSQSGTFQLLNMHTLTIYIIIPKWHIGKGAVVSYRLHFGTQGCRTSHSCLWRCRCELMSSLMVNHCATVQQAARTSDNWNTRHKLCSLDTLDQHLSTSYTWPALVNKLHLSHWPITSTHCALCAA